MEKIIRAQRSEWRLATLLIGAMQVLWSVLPFIGGDWRLTKVLKHYHQEDEWFIIMATLGVILIAGATLRWRAGRQIGLILSCGMWIAYFSIWLQYILELDKWFLSPIFVIAPLLSLFCFLLLINDVMQKPVGEINDNY